MLGRARAVGSGIASQLKPIVARANAKGINAMALYFRLKEHRLK